MFIKVVTCSQHIVKMYQMFSKHDKTLKHTIIINLKRVPKITLNQSSIYLHYDNSMQELEFENKTDAEKEFHSIYTTLTQKL